MEIKQLKSEVVDKIAAGEVVERPSHLLKELVENSIDAKATEIDIEVDEGGKRITVIDNGRGVLKSDFKLLFARHATSKIEESDDLWRLSTFGFRGEALASISSVCQMEFTSKRQGEEKAYTLHSEFGRLGELLESSFHEGTQVRIKDLFSNIPARLKFLKSDSAELTQIKNVIKAMALQYPEVQWKLKSKGKLVYFWPKSESLLERVKKVLEVDNLYECEHDYDGFHAHVIFSDPSDVVRVSRQIWTFVQNRWVQDKTLQAAVMEAYRSLLMHGQYPYCYVSVTCPPDEVDVNIHPTKSAVKFVDAKKAFRSVHYALREAIEKAPWRKGLSLTPTVTSFEKPEETIEFQGGSFKTTQFKQKSYPSSVEPPPQRLTLDDLRSARDLKVDDALVEDDHAQAQQNPLAGSEPLTDKVEVTGSEPPKYWTHLQVIGQLNLTYIVAQDHDKMVLVDQHAAHERVAFEKLMLAWKQGGLDVQPLLFPLTIDLEESEVEALVGLKEELARIGIEIEQEGPASLAISSIPVIIREKGLVEALKKLAFEMLDKGGSFVLEKTIGDIFATMACHSVIRAGQALSHDEMHQLLCDMDEFPLSGYCPHGRSVSVDFDFIKLEKDFGRRV